MDHPLLVPDRDVLACYRFFVGYRMVVSLSEYQHAWIPYALGRIVTREETEEILGRINGFGPHRFARGGQT